MNINLKRQDHRKPDRKELDAMRRKLENIISSDLEAADFDWPALVESIVQFQGKDGSFNLLDSYRIDSDCSVYYCYEPTYICTALLMKAYLLDNSCLGGKEESILPHAMHMCCARELQGHGYDATDGLITAVNYFIKCDVTQFLDRYPGMCPEFTEMFRKIQGCFEDRVKREEFLGYWGENYEESIRAISSAFRKTNIFVYGTLMKGQSNHRAFLKDDSFIGSGMIDGYDMYDLGYFPGIVSGTGKVCGEVYSVTPEELKCIDGLEGEGSLYKKEKTTVQMAGKSEISAFVYVYLGSVSGRRLIHERYGEKMVWYVAYGSNLLRERLKYYIQGGNCPANGRNYAPCDNTDMPSESRPVTIPYSMFYSNYDRGAWKNSAVCFLDLGRPGRAYGRAYLVTEEQLKHIHGQEGKGPGWYPERIRLDDIEGFPAYTFGGYQSKTHEPFYRVSAEYGVILYRGLHEAYPELSENAIVDYLRKCGE